MQDNWSTYYQGQVPPQAGSSSGPSYEYVQQQQQQQQQQPLHQQQQHLHHHMTSLPASQSQEQHYHLPISYKNELPLSMSMRSGTSSSISSSISSAGGHVSPSSMRTSMSSSTGFTPTTPSSSHSYRSPSYPSSKDQVLPEAWFGSLQDSYPSVHVPTYDTTLSQSQSGRPTLCRMERMSISSPLPGSEQTAWNQTPVSTQQQLTPRRASIATFQSPPHSQVQSFANYTTQVPLYTSPIQSTSYNPSLQVWHPSMSQSFQPSYAYQHSTTPNANNSNPTYVSSDANSGMNSSLSPSYYSHHLHQQPSWQASSTMQSQIPENFNFAGVLLEPEDLHLLGPDPLATTPAPEPTYRPAKAGWQPTFTFGDTTPKQLQQSTMQPLQSIQPMQSMQPIQPMQQKTSTLSPVRQHPTLVNEAQSSWNFDSFHGFSPLVAGAPMSSALAERASSAPPPMEIAQVPMPPSLGNEMSRRRGSSVDSPAMLHLQTSSFPVPPMSPPRNNRASYHASPVYLGRGPASKLSQSQSQGPGALATRRATTGPTPLDLAKSVRIQSVPVTHTRATDQWEPPKSAPLPSANPISPSPTSPTSAKRRGNRRSMAPMFINFTTKDAKKLLSGVAPSGSSKRKREEEEARQVKEPRIDDEE